MLWYAVLPIAREMCYCCTVAACCPALLSAHHLRCSRSLSHTDLRFRAKLGEALERMDRVVLAIEQDTAQPSPFTVQLPKHLQQPHIDSVSPALQQAS